MSGGMLSTLPGRSNSTPRIPVGKVLKTDLRQQQWQDASRKIRCAMEGRLRLGRTGSHRTANMASDGKFAAD